MPPSVPGIRAQMQLKRAYEQAGGTFLMGAQNTDSSSSNYDADAVSLGLEKIPVDIRLNFEK